MEVCLWTDGIGQPAEEIEWWKAAAKGAAMDCKNAIFSQDMQEFFVQRAALLEELSMVYGFDCILPLDENYAVGYVNTGRVNSTTIGFPSVYSSVPRCYAIMEEAGDGTQQTSSAPVLEEMGIAGLDRLPYLDLSGRGVIIGFIDTGIDYTHPVFKNPDGTSRITAIWDQNVEDGTPPQGFAYGVEYTGEQISQALESGDPQAVVPERDENGHGTFVAGVAAGNRDRESGFSGVAPFSDIMMVKLKPAKAYLKSLYKIPQDAVCFQETDMAWGLQYLMSKAAAMRRPLVVCMTLGTNSGGHSGRGILDSMINSAAERYHMCVVTSTGNESSYGLHYRSEGTGSEYEEVELRIGERERGFTMELWAESLNQYSVSVVSPTGELIRRIPDRRNHVQQMNFLFEDTRICVNYFMSEGRSGNQLILMRVMDPTAGIWRFQVYEDRSFGGGFDIWLPVHNFVTEDTYFLRADPYVTIADPGNASEPITVATYRVEDGSVALHSGRGFTRTGGRKPDVAAPGVSIYGPESGGGFGTKSGGGIASALTAGGCALFLEWAVVDKRQPQMRTQEIKRLLQGGAEREGLLTASRELGYGLVNFYGAFEELRIVAGS